MLEKGIAFLGAKGAGKSCVAMSALTRGNMVGQKASLLQIDDSFDEQAYRADAWETFDRLVFEVGASDENALRFSRIYAARGAEGSHIPCYYIINPYSEPTFSIEDASRRILKMQDLIGIPIHGLINNGNIGEETTAQHLIDSAKLIFEICDRTAIPLFGTSGTIANVLYAAHMLSPKPSGTYISIDPR